MYVVANGKILFFFMAKSYAMVYRYHSIFIHSFTDGHMGCFPSLAIVNNTAVNVGVHAFSWSSVGVSSDIFPGWNHCLDHFLKHLRLSSRWWSSPPPDKLYGLKTSKFLSREVFLIFSVLIDKSWGSWGAPTPLGLAEKFLFGKFLNGTCGYANESLHTQSRGKIKAVMT